MKSSTYYSAAKKADAYGHKNLADRFRKAGDAAVKNEQTPYFTLHEDEIGNWHFEVLEYNDINYLIATDKKTRIATVVDLDDISASIDKDILTSIKNIINAKDINTDKDILKTIIKDKREAIRFANDIRHVCNANISWRLFIEEKPIFSEEQTPEEEVKQAKEAKKEKEKEENGKIVVSKFYHAVNDALLSGGNSDFRDVIIARFVDKLKLCGNVGYFVVIAHKSTVYYLTEDKTETSSLNKVKLFATEEEANKFCLEYESKYYKEVVSLSIGKKEKAVNFDITDELKKYAYYLNQAINYKYTSVHIADRAILRIRQQLKEDSDKCYYIMNTEYKFYDGQKFSNIWDVHLYKKEELNGINVKELGYLYKFTLDIKVTDLYLDKKFYIYLEKGFKTSFIEQHLIEQNLTQGYYVVSWNEKEGTHSYLSYLNTFDSNSDKMKIFKNKPEIKSENDIYYKVVPCNVSENKVKETLETYKQGTKELFYKYKVKGYVIVTNDMSIIGPIKVLTEQGTFNKIDNRQKINTILTFSSAEQAEEYWNSLIKKKPKMYKRTHRVYRVC